MLWNSNQCSNLLNHLSSPNRFVVVVPDETMPIKFAFYFFCTSLLLRHLSLVHGHVSFFIFSLFMLPFNLLWLGQLIAFLRQRFTRCLLISLRFPQLCILETLIPHTLSFIGVLEFHKLFFCDILAFDLLAIFELCLCKSNQLPLHFPSVLSNFSILVSKS